MRDFPWRYMGAPGVKPLRSSRLRAALKRDERSIALLKQLLRKP